MCPIAARSQPRVARVGPAQAVRTSCPGTEHPLFPVMALEGPTSGLVVLFVCFVAFVNFVPTVGACGSTPNNVCRHSHFELLLRSRI